MRGEDDTVTQSTINNSRSAVTSLYRSICKYCRSAKIGTTQLRPLRQWTTHPARDNVAVAFSQTTIVANVNTIAAAGTAARSGTSSDQDAASGIAAVPSSRTRARTCLGFNYQIPARHAILSRSQTVLRSVRRHCTRQIQFAARIPAPANPLPQTRSRPTPSPTMLHFLSSPPPGPTSLHSSNDTGNEASPNSSSSSSERNLDLHDTAEPGLTDANAWAAPIWSQADWEENEDAEAAALASYHERDNATTDENIVTLPQGQNLNSHGTHSVPIQVIAQLYSNHFSSRENVAAKSQEIAELYNQHFPDEWYSVPENVVADAVAVTADTVAGTTDTVAGTDDTAADSVNANAASVDSSFEYHDDDEAYDATYDNRNWQQLQREADAESQQQHFYTRQRQGRPDWGIQDPGWHAPRAPTSHPDAKPPSHHRLQDWNVRVTKFTDKSGYTIKNADIIYRLPSAPSNTVRYHPPFVPGTLEHQLHRRPLSKRLHVMHQLRDILLTEEEETYIREQMDPVSESFSLSLSSTSDISCQTERYHYSMEHLDYEESLRAARDGDYRPRLLRRAADMASQTHSIPTLPPLPPFIPKFFSCRVLRRQSI
jgi:hypothetical protein